MPKSPNPDHSPAKMSTSSTGSGGAPAQAPTPQPQEQKSTSSPKHHHQHDFNSAHLENVFIGISGLIGAGKTTLATALAHELDLPVYYEPVTDNEYLADFYKDIKKYSFPMQVYLLNKRFKQQQQIIWTGKGGVQDRTIYEDSVFAKMLADAGLMEKRDYQTYLSLFQHMSNFMKKPNLIVHLDVSPEESLKRINSRNRDIETGITLEYLKGLHAAYEDFLRDISRVIPVLKVDYSEFRTAKEMAHVIADHYRQMQNVREVHFGGLKLRNPTPKSADSSPKQAPKPAQTDEQLSA